MGALIKAFITLAPVVKDLVVAIVKAIKDSPNPEESAKRALDEARRLRAFEDKMRRRK